MTLTNSNDSMLKKGSIAPEFNLPGTDGKNHSLGDYSGKKAYLVVFMCNHCPYVKHVQQGLVELANDYISKGVSFIAIN